MATKEDIVELRNSTHLKLDKIIITLETIMFLLKQPMYDAFQQCQEHIISEVKELLERIAPPQNHKNDSASNMDGRSAVDNAKSHSRTSSIDYEADKESDSEIALTNPNLPLGKSPKVTKKHKTRDRKNRLRPEMEEGNTLIGSGDDTDTLLEKTMAGMEAEGKLNIDEVIPTADEKLDDEFDKANLNDKDTSNADLRGSSPYNVENDLISNAQDPTDGNDLDLEEDSGLFLQLEREGGNELFQCTRVSPDEGQECFSDDSDSFEKISELPKQNANSKTNVIKTGLQRLWTPVNQKPPGQDEGYSSLSTNGSSLSSNAADTPRSLSLRTGCPDEHQPSAPDKSTDDESENCIENSFEIINPGHEKIASFIHDENLFHMDPVQLLESASLSPSEVLKDIILNALKDPKLEAHRNNGMDTVVLWDVSGSTCGKLFHQIKASLTHLIHSIDSTVGENIGIVTVGRDTKILHQLTNDFTLLLEAVETVTEAGGTTPLTLGLLLCHIEIQKRGGPTSIGRYHVPPRIIIITDGRPTEDVLLYNEELETARKDPRVKDRVIRYAEVLHTYGYQIYCVSVGASSSVEFLRTIATVGEGTVCDMDNMSSLYKHFLYQSVIGRTIALCKETGKEDQYETLARNEIDQIHHVTWDATDVDVIIEGIKNSGELKDDEIDGLPPLGSRVKKFEGHSNYGASSLVHFEGTVIKHVKLGFFKVLWDDPDDTSVHNINSFEANELTVIDTPRPYTSDGGVAPGMGVIPARGEVEGRVFEVTDSGFIKIRWTDGTIEKFTYDDIENKFYILPT